MLRALKVEQPVDFSVESLVDGDISLHITHQDLL